MFEVKQGMKVYGSQQIDINVGREVLEAICMRNRDLPDDGVPLYVRLSDIRGIEVADYDLGYVGNYICFRVTWGCDNPLTWGKVSRVIQEYLEPGSVEEVKYGSTLCHESGAGDTGIGL